MPEPPEGRDQPEGELALASTSRSPSGRGSAGARSYPGPTPAERTLRPDGTYEVRGCPRRARARKASACLATPWLASSPSAASRAQGDERLDRAQHPEARAARRRRGGATMRLWSASSRRSSSRSAPPVPGPATASSHRLEVEAALEHTELLEQPLAAQDRAGRDSRRPRASSVALAVGAHRARRRCRAAAGGAASRSRMTAGGRADHARRQSSMPERQVVQAAHRSRRRPGPSRAWLPARPDGPRIARRRARPRRQPAGATRRSRARRRCGAAPGCVTMTRRVSATPARWRLTCVRRLEHAAPMLSQDEDHRARRSRIPAGAALAAVTVPARRTRPIPWAIAAGTSARVRRWRRGPRTMRRPEARSRAAAGGLDREARLADAAGARQRHQTAVLQRARRASASSRVAAQERASADQAGCQTPLGRCEVAGSRSGSPVDVELVRGARRAARPRRTCRPEVAQAQCPRAARRRRARPSSRTATTWPPWPDGRDPQPPG